MVFRAPQIAGEAKPGQFVHVRCANQFDPLLRRPFSIYKVDERKGNVEIAYKMVGKGTTLLSGKRPGELLEVLGPLGRGFTIKGVKSALLVGEGVGVASLMHLAGKLTGLKIPTQAIVGVKKRDEMVGEEDFKTFGVKVRILHGGEREYQEALGGLMEELLREEEVTHAFGCGSNHMLAITSQIAERHDIPYQVSLYQNMACGIGACLCCARKFKSDFGVAYRLVCRDGPVFDSREVVWEV
jgi:dihydroorotate dehydrogenase electron transfer subunit